MSGKGSCDCQRGLLLRSHALELQRVARALRAVCHPWAHHFRLSVQPVWFSGTRTADEIAAFVAEKGVTFPIFSKIKVNGPDAIPLYHFLKSKLGGLFGSYIKWNFTKFLRHRNGVPRKRFGPTTALQMESDILALLEEE